MSNPNTTEEKFDELVVAQITIGRWIVQIEEAIKVKDEELYERCFVAFRRDTSGKLITENFDGILQAVEFAQGQEGFFVFGYPETLTLTKQAISFWKRRVLK